jgi:hypothetical protein
VLLSKWIFGCPLLVCGVTEQMVVNCPIYWCNFEYLRNGCCLSIGVFWINSVGLIDAGYICFPVKPVHCLIFGWQSDNCQMLRARRCMLNLHYVLWLLCTCVQLPCTVILPQSRNDAEEYFMVLFTILISWEINAILTVRSRGRLMPSWTVSSWRIWLTVFFHV